MGKNTMIKIFINNKLSEFKKNSTLLDVMKKNNANHDYCAIALNGNFVPRPQYAAIILQENDVIDIVMPMQGG
jgi:sulfur carrier protein